MLRPAAARQVEICPTMFGTLRLATARRVTPGTRGSTASGKLTLLRILPFSRYSRTVSATMTAQFSSASTGEAEENCAVMVADTVREYLENGNIRNSVNFPEAVLPRVPGVTRLAVANRNVPNMVGQISTCLAAAGLNIADLLNKSRGEFAYTLIDIDSAVPAQLLGQIRDIEGVLAARIL